MTKRRRVVAVVTVISVAGACSNMTNSSDATANKSSPRNTAPQMTETSSTADGWTWSTTTGTMFLDLINVEGGGVTGTAYIAELSDDGTEVETQEFAVSGAFGTVDVVLRLGPLATTWNGRLANDTLIFAVADGSGRINDVVFEQGDASDYNADLDGLTATAAANAELAAIAAADAEYERSVVSATRALERDAEEVDNLLDVQFIFDDIDLAINNLMLHYDQAETTDCFNAQFHLDTGGFLEGNVEFEIAGVDLRDEDIRTNLDDLITDRDALALLASDPPPTDVADSLAEADRVIALAESDLEARPDTVSDYRTHADDLVDDIRERLEQRCGALNALS